MKLELVGGAWKLEEAPEKEIEDLFDYLVWITVYGRAVTRAKEELYGRLMTS